MTTESTDSAEFRDGTSKTAGLDRLARRALHSRLRRLKCGQIVIIENGEYISYGELTEDFPSPAPICVTNPKFYSDVAFGGTTGAGEAFIRGYWTCDELSTLVRILLRNRDTLENVDSGVARLTRPVRKTLHWLNKNTRKGSRRNIAAHYDLGNDF
ncbi:MAG: SAM-dependent methyltransferase, partial [Gammaproteobacteria bacterium]|nr:SAM-dependent methyltransferase [Gammaproteobacteria bacterium]